MAQWSTAPTLLTPHGAQALTLLARWQAEQWRHLGLLPAHGCPSPHDLAIHANATQRTIASAHALAEGFAPGCNLPVEHKPLGQHDALFEPMEAGAATLDGRQAAEDVNRYTAVPPPWPRDKPRLWPRWSAFWAATGHPPPAISPPCPAPSPAAPMAMACR
jgi:hypothetical protein